MATSRAQQGRHVRQEVKSRWIWPMNCWKVNLDKDDVSTNGIVSEVSLAKLPSNCQRWCLNDNVEQDWQATAKKQTAAECGQWILARLILRKWLRMMLSAIDKWDCKQSKFGKVGQPLDCGDQR
jgi:hypothetical protein